MDREQRLDYKLQTDRLRILVEFLSRPVQCAGGKSGADPDVIAAYNNATETSLKVVRQLALETPTCSTNSHSSSPSVSPKACGESEPQSAPSGQNSTV
jgi:hypothetical protein